MADEFEPTQEERQADDLQRLGAALLAGSKAQMTLLNATDELAGWARVMAENVPDPATVPVSWGRWMAEASMLLRVADLLHMADNPHVETLRIIHQHNTTHPQQPLLY